MDFGISDIRSKAARPAGYLVGINVTKEFKGVLPGDGNVYHLRKETVPGGSGCRHSPVVKGVPLSETGCFVCPDEFAFKCDWKITKESDK